MAGYGADVMYAMSVVCAVGLAIFVFGMVSFFLLSFVVYLRSTWRTGKTGRTTLGFFHPYCNAGGGGERVLWAMLRAIEKLEDRQNIDVVIYTGDKEEGEEILANVRRKFGIDLKGSVSFVRLRLRKLIDPATYPRFTLVGQSIGSILLGMEALLKRPANIFVDTTGFAFTYRFAKTASLRVVAYVHYPTVSLDMLASVEDKEGEGQENLVHLRSAQSGWKRSLKLRYYRKFAESYGVYGSGADVVYVNSSWTARHIRHIWKLKPFLLYPPCDVAGLRDFPLSNRVNNIVSIGQFRPEKNHALQLKALHAYLAQKEAKDDVQLVMIGGVRNDGDRQRVAELRQLAGELGVEKHFKILENAPYSQLREELSRAKAGIHTMWNEHFGIGVVEYMAAGVVPIAHNSGGPKADIVCTDEELRTGYLATTVEEYAAAIHSVMSASEKDIVSIARRARDASGRFSDEQFDTNVLRTISLWEDHDSDDEREEQQPRNERKEKAE
mmetsp:Transcript_23917/g.60488  ORF Transcript_23917/g.60488 Transcript_23917/m.60488 type:complete len:497 (-) Transcript_23917:1264-2754(-)